MSMQTRCVLFLLGEREEVTNAGAAVGNHAEHRPELGALVEFPGGRVIGHIQHVRGKVATEGPKQRVCFQNLGKPRGDSRYNNFCLRQKLSVRQIRRPETRSLSSLSSLAIPFKERIMIPEATGVRSRIGNNRRSAFQQPRQSFP
jgi:hypothetical protein